jgi:outer membrane protein OmpA-like peptidoglycan-associated protein
MLKNLTYIFLLSVTACTTISDDVPPAFEDAQFSLARLENRDVKRVLPSSVNRAKDKYSQAVLALKNAREEYSAAMEVEAIGKAIEARQMADDADRLYSQIEAWDSDSVELQSALAVIDDYNLGSVSVTVLEPEESPFAKLRGTEFQSTLAYFGEGSARILRENRQEMESVAEILIKDPNFKVTLVGYSARGEKKSNDNLGVQRAKAVARILRENGVQDSQIELRSVGESEAKAEGAHRDTMLLDRKVLATLTIQ